MKTIKVNHSFFLPQDFYTKNDIKAAKGLLNEADKDGVENPVIYRTYRSNGIADQYYVYLNEADYTTTVSGYTCSCKYDYNNKLFNDSSTFDNGYKLLNKLNKDLFCLSYWGKRNMFYIPETFIMVDGDFNISLSDADSEDDKKQFQWLQERLLKGDDFYQSVMKMVSTSIRVQDYCQINYFGSPTAGSKFLEFIYYINNHSNIATRFIASDVDILDCFFILQYFSLLDEIAYIVEPEKFEKYKLDTEITMQCSWFVYDVFKQACLDKLALIKQDFCLTI